MNFTQADLFYMDEALCRYNGAVAATIGKIRTYKTDEFDDFDIALVFNALLAYRREEA